MENGTVLAGIGLGLLLALVVAGVVAALVLVSRRGRDGAGDGAVALLGQELRRELGELRTQLATSAGRQEHVTQHVTRTMQDLEALRAAMEQARRDDQRNQEMLARLQAVFTGSFSKGKAGEQAVEQALRALPAEMVQRDVAFGTRTVEFALVMPGGRLLVLDSKVVASADLLALEDADDASRERASRAIADAVRRKAGELARYRDPDRTADFAIAAIPDAAWVHCGGIQAQAWEQRVVLVPYSMLLPYVLAVYQLHWRYSRDLDRERLLSHLDGIALQLDAMDRVLTDHLAKAAKMTSNAQSLLATEVGKARLALDRARGLAGDEALPGTGGDGEPPELPAAEPPPGLLRAS